LREALDANAKNEIAFECLTMEEKGVIGYRLEGLFSPSAERVRKGAGWIIGGGELHGGA
jgi:hypothetical protein